MQLQLDTIPTTVPATVHHVLARVVFEEFSLCHCFFPTASGGRRCEKLHSARVSNFQQISLKRRETRATPESTLDSAGEAKTPRGRSDPQLATTHHFETEPCEQATKQNDESR